MKKSLGVWLAITAVCLTTATLVAPVRAAPGSTERTNSAPSQVTNHGAGWSRVTDPLPYLLEATVRGYTQVLHVDTEHATEDGFWYAKRNSEGGKRGVEWVFQPYGLACQAPAAEVVFNPWTNAYSCLLNAETVDNLDPANQAVATSADCRRDRPWSLGYVQQGLPACLDLGLKPAWAGLVVAPAYRTICAPWEMEQMALQGRDLIECTRIRYDWDRVPEGLGWVPAPDECTGAPADFHAGPYPDDGQVPDAPGCTGQDPAPNCTAAQTSNPACAGPVAPGVKRGWPETEPAFPGSTVIVRVDATGDRASGTAVATVTRTVAPTRRKVTFTASRRIDGRVFNVTRSARTEPVSETATRTWREDWSQFASPATAVATCTASDPADATACATEKATLAASAQSTRFAQIRGEAAAMRGARATAALLARGYAERVTAAEQAHAIGIAKGIAVSRAERALDQMVKRYLAGR